MKISAKTLGIAAVLVLVGFYMTKILTQIPEKRTQVVSAQSWLVLGKSHSGGMKTQAFENFFKECTALRKQLGDSLPELTRYYVEPTERNEKYTEVFSGVIIPDSTISAAGYQVKQIKIGRSVQVQHGISAGLYPAIEKFALKNELKLNSNEVVEILDGRQTSVLIELE